MDTDGLNTFAVVGRDLLLVESGGPATHLAGIADRSPGRAAAQLDPVTLTPIIDLPIDSSGEAALTDPRWNPSTLCGRRWYSMAGNESLLVYRGQQAAPSPTCRSCLRVVDTWFPKAEAPSGVELLASTVADKVEELGSARVTGVPAIHVEALRKAVHRCLRARGFRSQTLVVDAVVHVFSQDAYDALDPALTMAWTDRYLCAIEVGATADDDNGQMSEHVAPRDEVHWNTWVVDG